MMVRNIMGALAFAASLVGVAPIAQAQADDSEYISRLREEIPTVVNKYGTSALINEGYTVCSMLNAGKTESAAERRVKADMPMSDNATIYVVILAEAYLGC